LIPNSVNQLVDPLVPVRYYPEPDTNILFPHHSISESSVLVGKAKSVGARVRAIVYATFGVTFAGVLFALAGAAAGLWTWPPQPSSPLGVTCGIIGGFIVFFEMAILPRKWFRGQRLGRTRAWMAWHVWLGLICLPVILVHAGFGFGGPLTTVTLWLFLITTFSGVWGLIMQQWLPQKMLEDIPGESIASQIDRLGSTLADEASRSVTALVTVRPEEESAEPVVMGALAAELVSFRDDLLLPYLQEGHRSRSPLATPADAAQRFARLREAVPPAARLTLDRLQELADLRRRWDSQSNLHFWLHNWLLIHLPISVAMTSLMVLHAVRALKFW
jgi:hypothetical protein